MNYQNYELKKIFDSKLIGIGFVFLIDYNIGAVDILPDWIGLALIFLGIGKAAYINSDFGYAVRYIKIWSAISIIKFILTVVEYSLAVFNDSDMLLFATIFGFIDLFFSFAVFKNIILGCDMFLHIDNQFDNATKLAHTISPIIKVFFIIKFFLTILSQLPLLLSEAAYDYLSVKYNIYFTLEIAKNILLPPCFVVSTLFGIFAASLIIPLFYSISKSTTLNDIIKDKVNYLFLNDKFFVLRKSFNTAFAFFAVGIAFFIDFEFDKINILPDFVMYICLLCGLKILNNFDKSYNVDDNTRNLNIYMKLGVLISLAAYICTTIYRSESMSYDATIFILRILASVFYILSVAVFFITAIRFFESIKKLQGKHIQFTQTYLHKYMTQEEVNTDMTKKQKNRFLALLSIISAAKIASFFIGDINSLSVGIYKFFVSVILFAFVALTIRYLYIVKNNIYGYYK